MDLIAKLREQRKAKADELAAIAQKAADENRAELTEEEQTRYDKLFKEEIPALDGRVGELLDQEERERQAGERASKLEKAGPVTKVTREKKTYDRGSGNSFFADVWRASAQGDPDARERLNRHRQEQSEEIQARKAAFESYQDEAVEQRFQFNRGYELERRAIEHRDISRVDGAGGEFVPPLWLIDEYLPLARAARVFADAFNVRPLPPGTDSINIPRVTGGTAVGVQTADNAAVTEQDMTTGALSVPVRTIAGQQDVAIQLLEQSPIAFDEVVFADLIADYNSQLDTQLISGSGAAGQLLGLLNVSGINAVTYTDASPTAQELYAKIADAANQAASGRKLPPTRIFMHSRRWYWHTAALDAQQRPLVVPIAQVPMNAMGRVEDFEAEGPVGVLQGLPSFMDMNMPVNLGAGTNEDRIIVARFADFWLWESFLRTRVLPEVLSGNLTVRLQVYNYVAGTSGRYPAGISVIQGTGLVTPTF